MGENGYFAKRSRRCAGATDLGTVPLPQRAYVGACERGQRAQSISSDTIRARALETGLSSEHSPGTLRHDWEGPGSPLRSQVRTFPTSHEPMEWVKCLGCTHCFNLGAPAPSKGAREGAQQSSVLQYDFLPVVLSAGAIQEGGFWAKSRMAFHYNLPPPLLTTMLSSSHKT